MKRIIAVICVLTTLLTAAALASGTFSAAEKQGLIRGDVNADGVVNINDVTELQLVLAQLKQDTNGRIKAVADFDGNGLGIEDATSIQKYLAEHANTYHIGEEISTTPTAKKDPYELPFIPV